MTAWPLIEAVKNCARLRGNFEVPRKIEFCSSASVMVMTLLSHFMILFSSLFILLVHVSKFNVHDTITTLH